MLHSGAQVLSGAARDKAAHDEGQLGHDARHGRRAERNGCDHQGCAATDRGGQGTFMFSYSVRETVRGDTYLGVFLVLSPGGGWYPGEGWLTAVLYILTL